MEVCRGIQKCPLLGGVRYSEVSVSRGFTVLCFLGFLPVPRCLVKDFDFYSKDCVCFAGMDASMFSSLSSHPVQDSGGSGGQQDGSQGRIPLTLMCAPAPVFKDVLFPNYLKYR